MDVRFPRPANKGGRQPKPQPEAKVPATDHRLLLAVLLTEEVLTGAPADAAAVIRKAAFWRRDNYAELAGVLHGWASDSAEARRFFKDDRASMRAELLAISMILRRDEEAT